MMSELESRISEYWNTHVVCWDKDGTLADNSQRQWMVPLIKEGKRTWGDFVAACVDDVPVPAALALMRMLASQYRQAILSGSEECPEAYAWLNKHKVPYHSAYFRQRGDGTESGLLKARWIKEMQANGCEVMLYVEDVPEIAEVIRREAGVPVLLLNSGYRAPVDNLWRDWLAHQGQV
jgi:hypothetical protein